MKAIHTFAVTVFLIHCPSVVDYEIEKRRSETDICNGYGQHI